MNFSRLVVLFLLISDIIVFFTMQNDFDDNGRWALVGFALILAIVWVYLGDSKKASKPVQKKRNVQEVVEEITEPEVDIPEVVTEDSMDGASLRERKMAKVSAARLIMKKTWSQ